MRLPGLEQLQNDWPLLAYYQRFESIVAVLLTFLIGLIIVVALFRLAFSVVYGMLISMTDPLDYEVFQVIFGEVLTLLIALEFNHTLQYVVTRQHSVTQTTVVILIALLALAMAMARKFIILDLESITMGQLLGLAAATLSLALTYWTLRIKYDD